MSKKATDKLDTTAWKDVYDCIYTGVEDNVDSHVCRCCSKQITCSKNSGHTNLKQHIRNKHEFDWEESLKEYSNAKSEGIKVFAQPTVSTDAVASAKYIRWILDEGLPFFFVVSTHTRANTRIGTICRTTMMKHVRGIGRIIDRKLRRIIPDRFGIAFDG